MLLTMLCIRILDDTYCMIYACSLYLYVVRFGICQMVYLTQFWVNVFRFRNIEMELCGGPGAKKSLPLCK